MDTGKVTSHLPVLTKQDLEQAELPLMSDEALLSSSLDGNLIAFDLLVDRYYDRIYGYLYRFLKDLEEARRIQEHRHLLHLDLHDSRQSGSQ